MLVLSRGQNDKVVFPTLGITVEILRVDGRKVRIGIDAPRAIPVVREEILDRTDVDSFAGSGQATGGGLSHAARNRLQNATLSLHMLQRMLEAGQTEDAEPTIFRIFNELKTLEEELAPARTKSSTTDGNNGRCRALIVEDDPNQCELLAGYLRLSGFEVTTAMDGLQAMVHLSEHDRTDVVLLDMKLPRFDGHKTVSAIRQNARFQSLKIFAVTGSDQNDSDVNIGPQGVDRWFKKPVDPGLLVHAIHDELAAECAAT